MVVNASDDVAVSTMNIGSCGSYLALPTDALGTKHIFTTWPPSTDNNAVFAIVATEASTFVIIQFGGDGSSTVLYDTTTFPDNSVQQLSIPQKAGVLSFSASSDLSGTQVTSNQPVILLVGDKSVKIGSGVVDDFVVSQFPPTTSYGTTFVVPADPSGTGYYMKVVAPEGATVTVPGQPGSPFTLGSLGKQTLDISGNSPQYIQSTSPLLVVQYLKSSTQVSNAGAPASLVVVPAENYRNDYAFAVTGESGYDHYLSVTIASDKVTGLLLDGVQVASTGWTTVAGSGSPGMVSRALSITALGHYINHADASVTFGAFVYSSQTGDCMVAFPAGTNLVGVAPVSHGLNKTVLTLSNIILLACYHLQKGCFCVQNVFAYICGVALTEAFFSMRPWTALCLCVAEKNSFFVPTSHHAFFSPSFVSTMTTIAVSHIHLVFGINCGIFV